MRSPRAVLLAIAALAPFGGASQARVIVPSTWQRVTFAPLAIPGTTEHMDVRVSQEVIADGPGGSGYQPLGTGGKLAPSFLRFDLEWASRNDSQCRPVPMPVPIADGKRIRIALRQGAAVVRGEESPGWIGVSNACGTTWFITEYFPTDAIGAEPVWFEVQAAERTYWVELPAGLARNPSSPAADEPPHGAARLPAYLTALTGNDILIPWATVRYALDRGGFVDIVDACDGVARVTLNEASRSSIDQTRIAIEIRRPDGAVFKGREISRSIGPRQSVFDFKSRGAAMARTWDALEIDVDGVRTVVTMPSSVYLLGLRLANWGDLHRASVPDSSCKD